MEGKDGHKVLTLSQAADRLGVQRGTLVRQTRLGRLKAWLAGSVYLVNASEVDRYQRLHSGKPGQKRMVPLRNAADLVQQLQRMLGSDYKVLYRSQAFIQSDLRPFEADPEAVDSLRALLTHIEVRPEEYMKAIAETGIQGKGWDATAVGDEDRFYWWNVRHDQWLILGESEKGRCFIVPRTETEIPEVGGIFRDPD